MILEAAPLHVRPGQSQAFEAAFREAQSIISSMPGYISHELQRCLESEGHYLLLVRWRSVAAHEEGFRKSPGYRRWRELLHHFYEPFPTVLHFEAVQGVPGREPSEDSMDTPAYPIAIFAEEAPARSKPTNYPEPFASRMAGRRKQPLGELFGLANFGVNLTRLAPGAQSALRHAHTRQDEFVYILKGHPTLHTGRGRATLSPGMCAGFKAGTGDAHHLLNETSEEVVYLEVGDRTPGDEGSYPDDDIKAALVEGRWRFARKDGTPY